MKTALIFGSSGLIGNNLVKIILQNNKYDQIKLFVRSEKENNNPKLEIIKTDFNNLEKHKNSIVGDDCFFCIGTTRKNTPNKNEYIKVEYNLPVAVAKMAKSNSVNHFIYVSSLGSNPNASGLYLKNKGQAEQQLINLNFSKLSIIRPSILLGNRKENRIGEKVAQFFFKNLLFLFVGKLRSFKPINAEIVAKAIIIIIQKNKNNVYFSSDKLEELGNN